MGCAESKSEEAKKLQKQNKMVEDSLKRNKNTYFGEIKLLLLGTGESGKSTFAKQMKILHKDGFSEKEKKQYIPVVYNNTITSMKNLVGAAEFFGYKVSKEAEESASRLKELSPLGLDRMTKEHVDDIAILWKDPGVQKAFGKRSEFQLVDSAQYCFENCARFAGDEYVPSVDDILHVRARTTGIVETTFSVDKANFRMVDVGGQRSERKKWIHCFEDVTALLYCASLHEYDMKLYEDERINRMEESIELFGELVNSKWFTKTEVLLFLNKADLFAEKIERVNLDVLWPDYEGKLGDFEGAWQFIGDKYKTTVDDDQNPGKHIYIHVTTATDTSNVDVVFKLAKKVILSHSLERLGFGAI